MATDYITEYRNVLTPDICQHIIQTFETNSSQVVNTYREGFRSFNEINLSQFPDTWKDIQTYLYTVVQEYIQTYLIMNRVHYTQFPEKYGLEEMRMKKYVPITDKFDYHVDVGDYASAKRFLVAFFYLNDVSHGGETEFPEYDKRIIPEEGKLVFFPATWTHLHKGHVPISGNKYIIGTYFHYV